VLPPANVGVYARQELFRYERLWDEVVCARFEPGSLGTSISLSAQQQHRHIMETRIRAKSATHLEAIMSTQGDVQQDDIGHLWRYQGIDVISVGHGLQFNVTTREGVRQGARDAWLVVNQQDPRHDPMLAAIYDETSRHG
jgi:hypothetical protein